MTRPLALGIKCAPMDGRRTTARREREHRLFLVVVVFVLGLLLLLRDRLITTGGDGRNCRLSFFGRLDRVTGSLVAASIKSDSVTRKTLWSLSYDLKCRPAQRMF
jgi:hypothetical protein